MATNVPNVPEPDPVPKPDAARRLPGGAGQGAGQGAGGAPAALHDGGGSEIGSGMGGGVQGGLAAGLVRLCFRCGKVLNAGAVPEGTGRDAKGREVCGTCAGSGLTPNPPSSDASQDHASADDERVVIDLGPSGGQSGGPRSGPSSGPNSGASGIRNPVRTPSAGGEGGGDGPDGSAVTRAAARAQGPSRSPHEPLEVLDDSPVPRRLPPARPAPELEDMSQYAPANQYRPRVPSTDGAGDLPERTCSECGYSLEGINTDQCPECGHVNARRRLAKSRVLQKESRRIARLEYLKPMGALGVGGVVVMGILVAGGDWGAVGSWIAGFPVRVAIGTLAYFLCCLWFFGFDAPWSLTGLRMAGTYAVADVPLAMVGLISFGAAMPMAYLVSIAISVLMFAWLFELEPADAWLLVAISAVVNVVIGVTLAVLGSMIF